MKNGKALAALAGLTLTVLGFVVGIAYRTGQDAQRLNHIEEALAAHVRWAELRSASLTEQGQAIENTSLAVQQMAGDIQEMRGDVRKIRDFYLMHGGQP